MKRAEMPSAMGDIGDSSGKCHFIFEVKPCIDRFEHSQIFAASPTRRFFHSSMPAGRIRPRTRGSAHGSILPIAAGRHAASRATLNALSRGYWRPRIERSPVESQGT